MPSAYFLLLPAWLLFARWAATLHRNSPRPHDPLAGIFIRVLRLYARRFHHLRADGLEHVPHSLSPGPLIVVANHTAGIDPLLIQVLAPFEIRWLMARDMMSPSLQPLWDWIGLIPVDRDSPRGDASSLRSALTHLKHNGVIGIFPEGAIARPRGSVRPFAPGVGLLIHKSRAPVLQAVIRGTPDRPSAWGSVFRRSNARVQFLPIAHFNDADVKPADIARELESRCREALSAL